MFRGYLLQKDGLDIYYSFGYLKWHSQAFLEIVCELIIYKMVWEMLYERNCERLYIAICEPSLGNEFWNSLKNTLWNVYVKWIYCKSLYILPCETDL